MGLSRRAYVHSDVPLGPVKRQILGVVSANRHSFIDVAPAPAHRCEMKLHAKLGRGANGELLRTMISFSAECSIEVEVSDFMRTGYSEKCPDRLIQDNGYRDNASETRTGLCNSRSNYGTNRSRA